MLSSWGGVKTPANPVTGRVERPPTPGAYQCGKHSGNKDRIRGFLACLAHAQGRSSSHSRDSGSDGHLGQEWHEDWPEGSPVTL